MSTPVQSYQTFYDISRFVLWAENPNTEEATRRASLRLSFRDGNPRFTVNTGVNGRDGMINFPMDVPHLVSIMSILKDVANGPSNSQFHIDSLAPVYVNDKPSQETTVVGVLHIGKTASGVVYLSVTADGKPKIVFPIRQSKFHVFRDQNKATVTDDIVSKHMALGIADMILNLVSNFMLQYTREEYTSSDRKPYAIGQRGADAQPKASTRVSTGFEDLDNISL